MLLICNRKSFLLIDLENTSDFLKTAGGCKNLNDARWLLFKWFHHYPVAVYEGMIYTGLYVYELEVPLFDGTNANYNNEEEYYFEYIVMQYDLFGYEKYDKMDVLLWD